MSEVVKPAEETPAPTTAATTGTETAPASPPVVPLASPTTETTPAADAITSAGETAPATSEDTPVKGGDAKVAAPPATEAVLGYKAPGLIHSLLFSKRFFWFTDEPVSSDSLETYLRAEKTDNSHPNAAWAAETGKGLLFFAKRAEDKSTPAGILNLSGISDLSKEGSNDFSFKVGGHKHSFQAPSTAERDNWVATVESKATEAKASKGAIVESDSYKANIDRYHSMGVGAAAAAGTRANLSKSRDRKSGVSRKSIDAKGKEPSKKDKSDTSSSSSDEEKKDKKSKNRSQSRKRASIFGLLGRKDDGEDKKDVKKDEKAEEKVDKKDDVDVLKEEDHLSKKVVKDEPVPQMETTTEGTKAAPMEVSDGANASQPTTTTESAAIAPSAAIASPEIKADEPKPEAAAPKSTDGQEKKTAKRNSIFGMSLFGGKKEPTSPAAEKSQGDVAPSTPAKDNEVLPVSDTAPKIDEPIDNKPIDTTAVTAPADSATPAHDSPLDPSPAEQTSQPAAKDPASPSVQKSNFMGFFKRQDSKIETKKEGKPEETVTSPTAAAADTSAVSESPATAATEEKPTTEKKRRTSFFNNFGTVKEKKSTEPTSDGEATKSEQKKSPLPQKIGDLFRKPSKAVASNGKQSEPTPAGTAASTEAGTVPTSGEAAQPTATEPTATAATSDPSPIATETTEPNPTITTSQASPVKASA